MKQRDLLKKLKAYARENGLSYAETQGGNHLKVGIGDTQTTIPRHREINEITARAILKQMGVRE